MFGNEATTWLCERLGLVEPCRLGRRSGGVICPPPMTNLHNGEAAGFTPGERDYIRRELDMFFSTYPRVADGFQLKTWRGGPQAGQAKLPPTAKGLVDRGLMRLDTSERLPRLFFTEVGMAELRAMVMDRRLMDPAKFAHVRQELGIDPVPPESP